MFVIVCGFLKFYTEAFIKDVKMKKEILAAFFSPTVKDWSFEKRRGNVKAMSRYQISP